MASKLMGDSAFSEALVRRLARVDWDNVPDNRVSLVGMTGMIWLGRNVVAVIAGKRVVV